MITINRQLRRYFVFVAVLSMAFIAIIANISIKVFFSNYLQESRNRDDFKVVRYVEQLYADSRQLTPMSLMSLMHYAHSEGIAVRLIDMDDKVVWSSGPAQDMHSMRRGWGEDGESDLVYKSYPFKYNGLQVGTIEVGRPKSMVLTVEDRQFLRAVNVVLAVAFLFSLIVAVFLSSRVAVKFLKPIHLIKENAKRIQDGEYKKLREIQTNTHELHELSVAVQELAERLDHQERLRKQLTSDFAHELRTPLATLQTHIEAFMDGVWEPDVKKLSIIHDEISRLTKIINELLELSVIESDDIKLNISEVDLTGLLKDLIESFEPLLMNKSIRLQADIADGVTLSGDADKLKRIFINVLSNAYKYTNENGLIRVALEQANGVIRVRIKDTGIGIPKEDLKYVFERFYRSDKSRSRGTGGAGIGLTITKALVEAHGGKVRIDSEEGKGTEVIIQFLQSP